MLNQERLSSQSSIYTPIIIHPIILTCCTSIKCQTTCWRYRNNIRLYINSVSHVINLPVSQCLTQKNWKQVITTYGISLYKCSNGWEAKENWGNNETSAVAYMSEAEFQRHTGCPRTHGKAVFGTLAAQEAKGGKTERLWSLEPHSPVFISLLQQTASCPLKPISFSSSG